MKIASFILPVSVVLLVFAGCNSSPENQIVGKWEVDKEAIREEINGKLEQSKRKGAADKIGQGIAAKMMEAMISSASMSIEFKADKTYEKSIKALGPTQIESGTWKLIDSNDKSITLELESKSKTSECKIELVGDNKIIFRGGFAPGGIGQMPLDKEIPMRRAKVTRKKNSCAGLLFF